MRFQQSSMAFFCRLASRSNSVISVLALACLFVPVLTSQELRPNPEQFVLEQLKAGKEADLISFAPSRRILSHEFVVNLIAGEYPNPEIQRHGVSIHHAVLKETLEVGAITVPFRVWLHDCDFEKGVDFGGTRFARDLSLGGSGFGAASSTAQANSVNTSGIAYFEGMVVEGTADFSNTLFHLTPNFEYAQFLTNLVLNEFDYRDGADFTEMTVKGPVTLSIQKWLDWESGLHWCQYTHFYFRKLDLFGTTRHEPGAN